MSRSLHEDYGVILCFVLILYRAQNNGRFLVEARVKVGQVRLSSQVMLAFGLLVPREEKESAPLSSKIYSMRYLTGHVPSL